MQTGLKNTTIYLIGFAGVGKLSVAREIAKLEEFRIIHSHLINNPVFSCIYDFSDGVPVGAWEQVSKIRKVVFETIAGYSSPEMNFIFTNELVEGDEGDLELYNYIEKLALNRKSDFFPVRLLADEKEHKKRIVSEGREEMFKSNNAGYVDNLYDMELLKINHNNVINIDTTNFSAQQTAKYILNEIRKTKCQ